MWKLLKLSFEDMLKLWNQNEQESPSGIEKWITASEIWWEYIQEKVWNSYSFLEGHSCCQHDFQNSWFNNGCLEKLTNSTAYGIWRFNFHSQGLIEELRSKNKKRPISICQYNIFVKGADSEDQYWPFYSLMGKTGRWTNKVAFWLINLAHFKTKPYINKEIWRISATSDKRLDYRKDEDKLRNRKTNHPARGCHVSEFGTSVSSA